jgi:hypothetical protein
VPAGCQPRPPGERAGVAEFEELLSANVAAEEHTGVRSYLLVVAELKHQPRWLKGRDGDSDHGLGRMRFDSSGQRKVSCVAVQAVHLPPEAGFERFSPGGAGRVAIFSSLTLFCESVWSQRVSPEKMRAAFRSLR